MSDNQAADKRSVRQKQTIPLRPLLGIHRDQSSTLVPAGAFTDVEGFLPDDSGLIRRLGFRTLDMDFPDITKWDYLASFIDDRGVKVTFGIGDGIFFELAGTGFIERANVYPNVTTIPGGTVTVTVGDRVILGTATLWKDEAGVVLGDKLTIADTGEVFTVDAIVSNTSVRVLETPALAAIDSDYTFNRVMTPAADWVLQVTRLDRFLYIVTGKNTVMVYNIDDPDNVYTYWEMAGLVDTGYVTPAAPNFIPKTIEIYKDRVWTGNIFSDADDRWYTSRVSWTPILSPLSFLPDAQFNELVSIGGEITCLRTLGNLLAVYFEFGIEYGRETQVPGDIFPVAFDKIESARRGVLQPNAVASALGGHFYVSTDNVYVLSQNLQVQPIADKAKKLMFRPDINKARYKIGNLFEAEGIYLAASTREDEYGDIWAMNFGTREWTKFTINADYATVFALGSRLTYADYPEGQIYSGPTEDYGGPCNDSIWDTTRAGSAPYFFTSYNVQLDDMSNGLAKEDPYLTGGQPNLTLNTTLVPIYGIDAVNIRLNILTSFTPCNSIFGGSSSISANDRFYITTGPQIHVFTSEQEVDYNDQRIITYLETGDFDLGVPDTYKTYYKMTMRLDEQAPARLEFLIEASDDSGLRWYRMGKLIINNGGKEGRCNFLHTGSATRFKISSESIATSYNITELTLDVKLRGSQFGDF